MRENVLQHRRSSSGDTSLDLYRLRRAHEASSQPDTWQSLSDCIRREGIARKFWEQDLLSAHWARESTTLKVPDAPHHAGYNALPILDEARWRRQRYPTWKTTSIQLI